ncbi:MAG: peptidylprolyl isomerase, partial [Rivularia sp. (in: cyanobacteria)]
KAVHLIWLEEIIQSELNDQLRETIISELFASWLNEQIMFSDINIQLDADDVKSEDDLLKQA